MNRPPAQRFEDLIVWQKSHALTLRVYRTTRSFPKEELFGLSAQMRRAAVSVPANIAEGFSRYYPREFARFLKISRGSLAEVADRLRSAVLRGLIEQGEADVITAITARARGACTRLIQYLDGATPPGS